MVDPEVCGFSFRDTACQPVGGVWATWVTVACLAVGTLACDQGSSAQGWVSDSVQTAQIEAAARELTDRFPNALRYDSVLAHPPFEKPYTVDVQRALVDPGRPVLFRAHLVDVVREDDRYLAVFNVPWLSPSLRTGEPSLIPEAYFKLWVEPGSLDRLLTLGGNTYSVYGTDFLVVAGINQVGRPRFTIEGDVQYDGDFGYSELHAVPAEFFVVTGDLRDFVLLGE